MSHRSQVGVVTAFVALLVTPMVLMIGGVRPEVDENRPLAAAPRFTPAAATDEATWSQLGAFLADRTPLRDHAIRAEAALRERVGFAEAARQGVPRGAGGWLYHDETLTDACSGPPPDRFLGAGDRLARVATDRGTPVRFVFIPDKVVVYPEGHRTAGLAGLLGLGGDGLPGCAARWTDDLAGAADRPWLVDLTPILTEEARRSEELLYFRRDTHWTDEGARHYLEAVLDEVAPGLFDPSEVRPSGRSVNRGDLAAMRGLRSDETAPELVVERYGVSVVASDVSMEDDHFMEVVSSRAQSDGVPLVEGTTVLIGDSFTRQALHLFVPYFEELVFLQRPYLVEHPIGEALGGRRADRIVIGQIQRNVTKGSYDELMQAVTMHLLHEQTR